MMEKLLRHLDKQLDIYGVITHNSKMIDASFVEVRRQHNSPEGNNQLKKEETPER